MASRSSSISRDSGKFERVYALFQRATVQEYAKISFEVTRTILGPSLPNKAYDNVEDLRKWYHVVLKRWLHDVFEPGNFWTGKLPSVERELALTHVLLEARNCGTRSIHRKIFRDSDGTPHEREISTYAELLAWCEFMFEILDNEEKLIDKTRLHLTLRYDLGVTYRHDEQLKARLKTTDKWVAEMTDKLIRAVAKGKPQTVAPDDEWLLVIWRGLADDTTTVLETSVSLFIDAVEVPRTCDQGILDDIVSSVWDAMRKLGPLCGPEPEVSSLKQVRQSLDAAKLWCEKQKKPLPRKARSQRGAVVGKSTAEKKKAPGEVYDAFLAHNSRDKRSVSKVAESLKLRGLRPWLDVEQIAPGRSFQDVIQSAIPRCKTAVIFIGQDGLGAWQTVELRTLISQCVKNGMPVIPVLLPRVQGIPPEWPFLQEFNWVRFKRSVGEKAAMDGLFWGITRQR